MRGRRILIIAMAGVIIAAGCSDHPEARRPTSPVPNTTTTAAAPASTPVTTMSTTPKTIAPPTTAPGPATTVAPHPAPPTDHPTADGGTWERWAKTNFVQPGGVAVAPNGAVWTATTGGLVEWHPDGTYREITDPEWPDPTPRSIVFTPNGDLWIGFHNHVFRLDASGSTRFEFPPTGPDWGLIELAVGPDGSVWAASSQMGVRRFNGETWEVVGGELPGRGDLDTFAVDGAARPWVGTYWSGLWVLRDDQWERVRADAIRLVRAAPGSSVWYAYDSGHAADTVVVHRHAGGDEIAYSFGATSVWEIAADRNGAYVGTNPLPRNDLEAHGVWHLSAGEVSAVDGPWDAFGRQILGLDLADDGSLWLGGQTGLWHTEGDSARRYLTDTVAGFSVGFVLTGRAGEVWAGDCRESSVRVGRRWEALPAAPAELWTCDATIDAAGTYWLAGWDGLAYLDGDQWTVDRTDTAGVAWVDRYPVCDSEACDDPYWALATPGDELWAGMVGVENGLWRLDADGWRQPTTTLPDESGGVVDLAAAEDGSLWVATSRGVHRRTPDGAWTSHLAGGGGPPDGLRTIASGGGVVWVSGYEELARFDGDAWTRYPATGWDHGLLGVDDTGAVWRTTLDATERFEGTETAALTLPDPGEWFVEILTIADDGSWWMSGHGNVYHWTP